VLEIPFRPRTVSKEQIFNWVQIPGVKGLSPIIFIRLVLGVTIAFHVLPGIDCHNVLSVIFPIKDNLSIDDDPGRCCPELWLFAVKVASWPKAHLDLSILPIHGVPTNHIGIL